MKTSTVPNYLPQAILVTIFCCVPLGIIAIVNAAQVNSKLQSGDYEGALVSSQNAKKWCWIAFILGIIFILVYAVIIAMGS